MRQATFRFTAGRLLCGQIRDMLTQRKFHGRNIQFYQSSGWFERQFIIRGQYEHVRHIVNIIQQHHNRNNSNEW